MKRWVLLAIAAFATVGFTALGAWQVERRAWKLALIERVEQRVHAAPVGAPGPAEWAGLSRENAEYRRVNATGRFMENRQTLVRAVTELGEGFWLMTPLQTDEGFTVLVNRGFVPPEWRKNDGPAVEAARAGDAVEPNAEGAAGANGADAPSVELQSPADASTAGPQSSAAGLPSRSAADVQSPVGTATDVVTVTGLLRISEPHGAFLRSNAPADNRWYSRDVDAISHAQHLTGTAPYFIDAEDASAAGPDSSRPPVAGLTVVQFRNSHLQYAITWFVLALMAVVLGVRVARNRV